MALDLPSEDDGGPDLFSSGSLPQPVAIRAKAKPKPSPKQRQPKKPHQQLQKRPAMSSSSRKRAASVMEGPSGCNIALPDDDPGDFLGLGVGGAPDLSQPRSILVDPQMVPFDDPTLKVAATHVPSIVAHPFHDIESILKNPRQPCDESLVDTLWEVYSVPRLQPIMNKLGGRCRRSFDLKSFWDFREPHYQKGLLLDLASLQPLAVMLSPPCTYVCQLMHSNWQRMDPKKRVINLQDACGHIDFSMWIATYQYQNDRYFGFEHPGGSLAWDRDSVS